MGCHRCDHPAPFFCLGCGIACCAQHIVHPIGFVDLFRDAPQYSNQGRCRSCHRKVLLVAITPLRRLIAGLKPRWWHDRPGVGGVLCRPLDALCGGPAESPPSDAFWPSRGAVSAFPVGEES